MVSTNREPVEHQVGMRINIFVIGKPQRILGGSHAIEMVDVTHGKYAFLISNTVSVGIAVRKEEIGIMKYIGATDAFVRAPFLLEGMVLGVVGAAVPLIVLYFCYNGAISYILTRFNVLTGVVDFIPVWQIYQTLLPISLGLGIGIGLIGSFFTTRKHLRV